MAHPLDGIRAKLDRADEHLEVLNAEIAAFLRGKPYAVVAVNRGRATDQILMTRLEMSKKAAFAETQPARALEGGKQGTDAEDSALAR